MFKKAQAAMEFLMTYGWAILVVLAAIGALAYFGVLSPGNFLPPKCEFEAGLQCSETAVADNSAGTIIVALTNSLGYDINYTFQAGIGSDDSYGCAITWGAGAFTAGSIVDKDNDGIWENGETAIVTYDCTTLPDANKRFRTSVTVNYRNVDSGMDHPNVGLVSGKVAT